MKPRRYIALPPEPATVPLHAGKVRRFHVTPTAAQAFRIGREGLRMSAAKGIEGPRGIYSWTSYKDAESYGHGSMPVVEFEDDPANYTAHPFASSRDVTPQQIIAIHQPWHAHARYALKNNLSFRELAEVAKQAHAPDYARAAVAVRYLTGNKTVRVKASKGKKAYVRSKAKRKK